MKLIRTICLALVALAIIKIYTAQAHAESAFRAEEFSLSLYGTGAIATEAREKEAISVGTGIGADYFLTKGFGIGARAELSDFSHSVIDRTSGRLTARAPLWDAVAPYGYVEGGFNFEQDRLFAGAGGGVEWRINKHVGTFAELGLETTTRGEATGRAAVGIRLPF